MLEKAHLFEGRTQGYHIYRVPGILCTKNNVLLGTAEARRGKGGDWDGNDVVMRRSTDGGKSWEPLTVVARCETYGEGPISNFVMISDQKDGAVHALFCHNYARVFYICSQNDGAAWSDPREITDTFVPFRDQYPWRVIATGPGHGIQLKNGRLIVPLWMSDGTGTEFGPGKLGHRPSTVAGVYSDDHGKTWPVSRILEPGPSSYSDLAQTADGTICCIYENHTFTRQNDTRYVTIARFSLEWLKEKK